MLTTSSALEELQSQPLVRCDVGGLFAETSSERVFATLMENSRAMQLCANGSRDEATAVLSDIFFSLESITDARQLQEFVVGAAQADASEPTEEETNMHLRLVDLLKAMTLNNLGIVECHKNQHKQALSHFDGARKLEGQWGIASPSVAVNTSAAYNAIGMYDRATAAALETIDMLRSAALKEQQLKQGGPVADPLLTAESATGDPPGVAPQASSLYIASSDNAALWGAAWHNLGVAQLHVVDRRSDPREHVNTLAVFQNALKATQRLLGVQHPMTKAVHATYRSVRSVLRSNGAFRQHRTFQMTELPPVADALIPGGDAARTRRLASQGELSVTLRGRATRGATYVERCSRVPYGPVPPPGSKSRRKGRLVGRKQGAANALCGMPLSDTLLKATELYGMPHPLLYAEPLLDREAPRSTERHRRSEEAATSQQGQRPLVLRPTDGSHNQGRLPPLSAAQRQPSLTGGTEGVLLEQTKYLLLAHPANSPAYEDRPASGSSRRISSPAYHNTDSAPRSTPREHSVFTPSSGAVMGQHSEAAGMPSPALGASVSHALVKPTGADALLSQPLAYSVDDALELIDAMWVEASRASSARVKAASANCRSSRTVHSPVYALSTYTLSGERVPDPTRDARVDFTDSETD